MAGQTAVPIYYADQDGWAPVDFQALWRYLNKLFLDVKDRRTEEIAALDVSRMSRQTQYLIKHLLVLQGARERVLAINPALAAVEKVELDQPLVLSNNPTYWHDYFTRVGIIL